MCQVASFKAKSGFIKKLPLYFFSTGNFCSSRVLVPRHCCPGQHKDTPWHLGPCTPLHPGHSLAAAWPDHCLPSTSLIAAATGSAQPSLHHCSLSHWPCCSHTSSVSPAKRLFLYLSKPSKPLIFLKLGEKVLSRKWLVNSRSNQ